MKTSNPTALIASGNPSFLGIRPEFLAFGLLLLGACLPAVIPQAPCRAESMAPTSAPEAEARPVAPRAIAKAVSADNGIRVMPTVIISADAIGAATGPEPLPEAVVTVPGVEIVPLAPLGSTNPTRP